MVYQDPTGCLTAFCFSPFEVRDDSNPSGDGLSHLSRAKLGGTATIFTTFLIGAFASIGKTVDIIEVHTRSISLI